MKVQKILLIGLVGLLLASGLIGQNLGNAGDVKSGLPSQPLEVAAYGSGWATDDRNGDGIPDHAVKVDKAGRNVAEVFDYNFDGKMDDFYSYESGMVTIEELDTNFDGQIDLWVHVYKGIYVAGYERDTNFDGKLDIVKRYGKDSIVKR